MYHLKGIRFGFPAIRRLGVISRLGIYPVRWNAHQAPELHFILKGQSAWEIEGDETPLRLNGGMFTVISAGVRHRAINDHGTPAIRLGITLEELGTLTDSLPGNAFLPEDLASLYRILNAQSGVARRMPPQLETHVREFLKSLEQPSLSSAAERLHLRILAASILDAAARALLQDEQTNISREKVIETICGWIDAHCTDPDLRPERLVTLSGYGRSRFFTLFFKDY